MPIPDRLVIATRNPGKVKEIVRICRGWPTAWVTFESVSWPKIEEAGASYLQNALLKAHGVAAAVGEAALADDSGIEVDAMGGGPGPRSARFAGEDADDADNLRLLIERLREVPPADRTARYRCVAALALPDGAEAWSEATCEGRLIDEPRGAGGFGYDPIFVPEGFDRTMAELSPPEKDVISHRGKALRALREVLATRG